MNRDDAFIELVATGVSPEDAKELLAAVEREPRAQRPEKGMKDFSGHQPVWAMMNHPFGISRGFRQMSASETAETFNFHQWEATLE